jgi:hydrogen peroxide-dependent heme synthase
MTDKTIPPVMPFEGWHVMHVFYRFEQAVWVNLSNAERLAARETFLRVVEEIRAAPSTQLMVFSMVTPKADFGFMLLTPDLHDADRFEKRLTRSFGPDVLTPVYSYLSQTERSEYTTSEADYIADTLKGEKKLAEGTPEFGAALAEFRERMAKYGKDRLYPNMPHDWEVFCFYPMSKRRGAPGQNWYATPFETRKKLMGGHARVGRQWSGKIRQLITGSTGLDEWEWGVTLFGHDPAHVKGIVYEMRFDEVSSQYAEFGPFYIGLQVPAEEVLKRIGA